MKTNYFENCETIEAAKKMYHSLLKENHPDKGGDTFTCQNIINQFESYLNTFTAGIFSTEENEKYKHFSDAFQNVINKIINFENMRIQVIGYWIYCFNSFEYKEELKVLGFWFSKKHKAWIFSGSQKKRIRTRLTTDDVRNIHGYVNIATEKTYQIA